jgi:hypothetical protein
MPFPLDDYTPHGYLDSPTHTRNLTPRGVVRSWEAGFRWHYPAHAGMYGGRRETYCAGLCIGLDNAILLDDFDAVSSPYHSKDIVAFELRHSRRSARVEYQLVGEHALHASILTRHLSHITILVEYTRLLSANGEWGESGLVGRLDDGILILQGFEDGDAFALWTSPSYSDVRISPDGLVAATALPSDDFVTATRRRGEQAALYAVLGFGRSEDSAKPREETRKEDERPHLRAPSSLEGASADQIEVILARGKTADAARRHLEEARGAAMAERARKQAADEAFWKQAPRLEGDWPAHWRRGLVYDLETLRMMVKQPLGIYHHIWDAMQIQAPRVVLAEAAIDALLLAYADPPLAQVLLLGTFLDAPLPNVPCSREDGTYNMVAADGTVCGTAPSWGFPFLVLEWLFALRPDRAWLECIYPHLAGHLDWWLAERRAPDGRLFYACSWESGQDDSPRFGDQPLGGGHPVRHIRPVDLHAAVAHAARTLARFATTLGRQADQAKWTAAAEEFVAHTNRLWDGERYADYDTLAGRFTHVDDITLLAPLALRLPEAHSSTHAVEMIEPETLTWPMSAWTAAEAALAAGMPEKAAEVAATICERAYGFWDARRAQPGWTLPGIACEYWPLDGRCGGEGYGWGAFTTHLLLHVLVGLTPAHDRLRIRPNLPPPWRAAGQRYTVHLHWRERPLVLTIAPLDADRVVVMVNERRDEIGWGQEVTIAAED